MRIDNFSIVKKYFGELNTSGDNTKNDETLNNVGIVFNEYFSKLRIQNNEFNDKGALLFSDYRTGEKYICGRDFISPINAKIDVDSKKVAAKFNDCSIIVITVRENKLIAFEYYLDEKNECDFLVTSIFDEDALSLLLEEGASFSNVNGVLDIFEKNYLLPDAQITLAKRRDVCNKMIARVISDNRIIYDSEISYDMFFLYAFSINDELLSTYVFNKNAGQQLSLEKQES